MGIRGSKIRDFLTDGIISITHNTVVTTSHVLVVRVPFGLPIILGLVVGQVVVFPEVELQSIMAELGRLTDSSLEGDTI